jgi:hypothetical protein
MARQTFFSFHYERDAWRAGQVRNCNLLPSQDQHGFIDAVDWESIKRQGDNAIRCWIDRQLEYTSVTVVLIGAETAARPWVQHEIARSWNRGNGIVGVRIHNIRDQYRETDLSGRNPFEFFKLPDNLLLSSVCKTYDWVLSDGRNNLGGWSEEAVKLRATYEPGDEISCAPRVSGNAEKVGVIPRIAASAAFAPRSPWCPGDAAQG